MKIEMVTKAMETLKTHLGPALLMGSIFSKHDGLSLAMYNAPDDGVAIFNRLMGSMDSALSRSGFGSFGNFGLIEYESGHLGLFIEAKNIRGAFYTDPSKTSLGLMLHVAVPDAIKLLEAAQLS
jgi:hypothetical protein